MPDSHHPDEVLVVAGAVVRLGRVLAARRTSPPESAGRWELPGGKVEPGESPEQALVRELTEELGCRVRVTGELPGTQRIRAGYRLCVLLAELVDGEPTPREHDALRWLGPEELDQVSWLAPDEPFVAALRDALLDGQRLEGGNVGGAVRIGRTVRRPTGPWTPAVHRFLAHLEVKGLAAVPRVHGIDARGREVLDHLPGTIVDVDEDRLSSTQLASATAWLRDLHDASRGFTDTGPWRWFDVEGSTVVGHNDVAPYNLCFEGDVLTGVFDWDMSGPTTPLFDLAQLAWTGVPLFRAQPPADVATRLELMASTYGGGAEARDVLHAVVDLKRIGVQGILGWIAAGDPAGAAQAAIGEPENTERALAGLLARMPGIERALA